jgi:hypothetical protein
MKLYAQDFDFSVNYSNVHQYFITKIKGISPPLPHLSNLHWKLNLPFGGGKHLLWGRTFLICPINK